jgi:hypothetical protein
MIFFAGAFEGSGAYRKRGRVFIVRNETSSRSAADIKVIRGCSERRFLRTCRRKSYSDSDSSANKFLIKGSVAAEICDFAWLEAS